MLFLSCKNLRPSFVNLPKSESETINLTFNFGDGKVNFNGFLGNLVRKLWRIWSKCLEYLMVKISFLIYFQKIDTNLGNALKTRIASLYTKQSHTILLHRCRNGASRLDSTVYKALFPILKRWWARQKHYPMTRVK